WTSAEVGLFFFEGLGIKAVTRGTVSSPSWVRSTSAGSLFEDPVDAVGFVVFFFRPYPLKPPEDGNKNISKTEPTNRRIQLKSSEISIYILVRHRGPRLARPRQESPLKDT
ncbi:hypothetical protein, partial [Salmonella enterica]|uniref:hypothetical protein n=1 Tax=Salmonella enterica TaxID=28901 RepID=UPI001F25F334